MTASGRRAPRYANGFFGSRLAEFGRRRFLGRSGAAVIMGLPLMDALVGRRAGAQDDPTATPKRLVALFSGNGMLMDNEEDPTTYWTPLTTGPDFELTPLLQYFEPIRQKITVVSGVGIPEGRPGGAGDHGAGTAVVFTAVKPKPTTGSDYQLGISFDQVAAQRFAEQNLSRIASLQLGTYDGDNNDGDGPFGAVYLKNISWASETQPLNPTVEPQGAFDQIFAGLDPTATIEENKRRLAQRQSLLDYVKEERELLVPALSPSDQQRLDQYFTSIREVEMRLANAQAGGTGCGDAVRPEIELTHPERVTAMMDLTVLALQCNATRVVSLHLGTYRNDDHYGFLGATKNHHTVSHYRGSSHDPGEKEEYLAICRYLCEQTAYLFTKMDQIQEPNGTLLDNSIGLYNSDCGESNIHDHNHLPVLLAGNAGGAFPTGHHLVFERGTRCARLYVTILNALGLDDVTSFGTGGDGPLNLG